MMSYLSLFQVDQMLAIVVLVFMITCMSYLILSCLPLFQAIRMLAIIVFVFMITCMSYLILFCLIFLYFRWFECWP